MQAKIITRMGDGVRVELPAEQLRNDLVFVASNLYEVGCDGFNFNTAASAGNADFLGTLEAIREIWWLGCN